jgi:hypothetical protein
LDQAQPAAPGLHRLIIVNMNCFDGPVDSGGDGIQMPIYLGIVGVLDFSRMKIPGHGCDVNSEPYNKEDKQLLPAEPATRNNVRLFLALVPDGLVIGQCFRTNWLIPLEQVGKTLSASPMA